MAQLRKYNSMQEMWFDVDYYKNILYVKDFGYPPLDQITYSFNADNPTTVIPIKVEFLIKIYVPSTGVQSVSLTRYNNSLIDSTSDLMWNYSNSSSQYTLYSTLTTSSPTSYYLFNQYSLALMLYIADMMVLQKSSLNNIFSDLLFQLLRCSL